MNDLKELRQTADECLAGLTAGPELKSRILQAKREAAQTKQRPVWIRYTALAAACVLVLVLGLTLGLRGRQAAVPVTDGPVLTAVTAGDEVTANERASLNRGSSSLSVVTSNVESAQGIWAGGTGESFPLVILDGRVYRQLTVHNLSEASLGQRIGTIWDCTQEPALSDSGSVSNVMPAGTEVYGVSGMADTLVACRTDTGIHLFQRVSYNGMALLQGETFADVMQLSGHVTALSLSGVGMVEGERAEEMFGLLAASAQYESAGSLTGSQVLLIELDNGAAVQMAVRNDRLAACGVWSCPEFFEAFQN